MDSKNTFIKMIGILKKAHERQTGKTPEIILYTAGGMVKGTLNLEMTNIFHEVNDSLTEIGEKSESLYIGDVIALKDATIGFPSLNATTINEMYFHKDAILGFVLFDGIVDYKEYKIS